jgi:hypothetical protein
MHFGSIARRQVRPAPAAAALALAVLLAAFAASRAAAAPASPSTSKVVALHEAMDKLWTDHVTGRGS